MNLYSINSMVIWSQRTLFIYDSFFMKNKAMDVLFAECSQLIEPIKPLFTNRFPLFSMLRKVEQMADLM